VTKTIFNYTVLYAHCFKAALQEDDAWAVEVSSVDSVPIIQLI